MLPATTLPDTLPIRMLDAPIPPMERPGPPNVPVPPADAGPYSNVFVLIVPPADRRSLAADTDTVSPVAMTDPPLIATPPGSVDASTILPVAELMSPVTVNDPVSAITTPAAPLSGPETVSAAPSFRLKF